MKKIASLLFLSLLFLCLSLTSCSLISSSIEDTSFSQIEEEIDHNYKEIKDKKLTWNCLFFDAKVEYSVYCYSLTCSHCSNIKNKVINYALNNENFYFYEDSSSTVLSDEIKTTIGISSSDKLVIKGFPTLLKINQKTLTKNIYGEAFISKELNL